MSYVIDAPQVAAVPVVGSEAAFPVRRIYCVGRNYAAHAREMGHDPDREPPFFFMKPADALVLSGATVPYPPATEDLQHEIELVVALKSGGADIAAEQALECVYGYGVGLDMTRRDLQGQAKKMGRPWEMGKGFDNSAPITALQPAAQIGHPDSG
ncbi:MAG TPA: fumarylacetoacetate hydrolase family protein, partial [Gammaproteobacteria bacterium]|nr:fumarylacetoacetate hydrolase family protein [Gammaproteobacteria bacterium]